jgi:phage shock protein PspC (stress-responsive transcriptional regulator)
MDNNPSKQKKPSKALYLFPIFLGFIGGILGYFLVKDADKKFAKQLLVLGFIVTGIGVIAYILKIIVVQYVIYPNVPGSLSSSLPFSVTSRVKLMNATCIPNSHYILTLRNFGGQTTTINYDYVNIFIDDTKVKCHGGASILENKQVTQCKITEFTNKGFHSFEIRGGNFGLWGTTIKC